MEGCSRDQINKLAMYRINHGSPILNIRSNVFYILFIEPISVQINYYISINLASTQYKILNISSKHLQIANRFP